MALSFTALASEGLGTLDLASWVIGMAASESLEASGSASFIGNLMFLATESVSTTDSATLAINMILEAVEAIGFIDRLGLTDGDYQAFVLNTETLGVTRYAPFTYNALFSLNSVAYGMNETGIYKLEGDDDDGTAIDARLAWGDMNFGTSREKNVPRAYLYLLQSGDMILKTIVSRQGKRDEVYYELKSRTTDGGDETGLRTEPLARGPRGVWWRFELHNADGADFDLTGAEVMPVILSRKG
jgi:hypothetical protein